MSKDLASYSHSLDCVHCGLCLETCPTYDILNLETDSPRGRIYLVRAMAEDRLANPKSIQKHLDQCLGCRACETACPSGVEYGAMLEATRHEMLQRWPDRSLQARLRRFLLAKVVPHRRRLHLAFTLARWTQSLGLLPRSLNKLLPKIPKERKILQGTFSPQGKARGRVHLFTGCIMEQAFGHINRLTLQLLLANGFEVVVPESQGCCGALLLHNGQAEVAGTLAKNNLGAFADAEFIINNSAGCGASLKEYGKQLATDAAKDFASRCYDISEFLAQQGLSAQPVPFPHKVAYDAPCHLCHGQGVRQQPLDLLQQVPELTLLHHPSSEDCCGSAGIYNLSQPKLAAQIGNKKVAALTAMGAQYVVTGNPGCMLQLQAELRFAGSSAKVMHPVELLLPK